MKSTHKKDLRSNPERMGNLQWFLSAKLKRGLPNHSWEGFIKWSFFFFSNLYVVTGNQKMSRE